MYRQNIQVNLAQQPFICCFVEDQNFPGMALKSLHRFIGIICMLEDLGRRCPMVIIERGLLLVRIEG